MNTSPDGQFIEYEQQEPTFYARIPKMAIMQLKPLELALYCHIKQTASDEGTCFKSNKTLSAETQMSITTIKKTRASLETKGFITVDRRHDEATGQENQSPIIKIVDVWSANHNLYAKGGGRQKPTPPVAKNLPPSREMPTGGSPETWGGSPKNPKEELFKKIDTKENSLRKKTVTPNGAPIVPKNLKYPGNLKNWKTAHFCQYHSEHRNEMDVLTSAFFSNVPGGITIPMMTNGESIGPVKLHQSLHRLGFPINLYPDLIQNTREVNLWKTNGISWEDVEKNVTAFRLKRKIIVEEESKTKDSLELENQKAYERMIALRNGAKFDAMGELIVEGVG